MTKKTKILASVLAVFVVAIIGFVSAGGTGSGLQGNLLGVKRVQSNVTVYVDGVKVKSFKATDLSKNLKPILVAIDKRYGINMAGPRGGLFDGINSIASRGIIPGNLIQGGNIYINGSINPFGSQGSTVAEDGMGLGMVEGFRDTSGFVANGKTPGDEEGQVTSTVDENGKPIKVGPKGEIYTGTESDNGNGGNRFERMTQDRQAQSSTSPAEDRFNRDIRPRMEDPNSDRGYGRPTVGDLMVNITTKNEALGAGTVQNPDSLDDFNELANPNYGVSNPGENGDSTINPGSLTGVTVTLDCARTSGDTYCGSNTRVNVQVVIVPNPQGGGVGGNPAR
jgi:hypothetical protein